MTPHSDKVGGVGVRLPIDCLPSACNSAERTISAFRLAETMCRQIGRCHFRAAYFLAGSLATRVALPAGTQRSPTDLFPIGFSSLSQPSWPQTKSARRAVAASKVTDLMLAALNFVSLGRPHVQRSSFGSAPRARTGPQDQMVKRLSPFVESWIAAGEAGVAQLGRHGPAFEDQISFF